MFTRPGILVDAFPSPYPNEEARSPNQNAKCARIFYLSAPIPESLSTPHWPPEKSVAISQLFRCCVRPCQNTGSICSVMQNQTLAFKMTRRIVSSRGSTLRKRWSKSAQLAWNPISMGWCDHLQSRIAWQAGSQCVHHCQARGPRPVHISWWSGGKQPRQRTFALLYFVIKLCFVCLVRK